MPKIIHH
jgi:hypothetical protein